MVDFYEAEQHFMVAQARILTADGPYRQFDGGFA